MRHTFRNVATGTEYVIRLGDGELEELEYTPATGSVGEYRSGPQEMNVRRLDGTTMLLTLPETTESTFRLSLVNSVGKRVWGRDDIRVAGLTVEVDLPGGLAAGHYFLRLEGEHKGFTGRVEVE